MGCTSCKISELESDYFKACRNPNAFVLDFQPLLSLSDRSFWTQQLSIKGIPEQDFWQQFNGFHHTCFTQISKDINRTFPTQPFFSNKLHVSRFELLLKKFAIYFPKIGYTQGLNFVAGYLLMAGFDDDLAFNLLVSLMVHEKILAIGLYQDQFPLNRFYCEVFWNLLNMKLPKIAEKIKKAEVQDQIWIFQWFISLFLYSFPTQYVKKFWDYIILKKQLSIVLIALGIVRCLKNDILNLKNPDQFDFLQLFQNLKDFQFCKGKIQIKKVVSFINTISQVQIQSAIHSTKCLTNQYRKYFTSPQSQRSQMQTKMMNYFKYQRTSFKSNPDPHRYVRPRNSTNQLEDLMLSKYKLYQSDFKRSNVASSMFKMSTFSIAVDHPYELGKGSGLFNINSTLHVNSPFNANNPFGGTTILNRINFTQSKVFDNGVDLTQIKRKRQFSPTNQKKSIKPFEEISQRGQSQFIVKKSQTPLLKEKPASTTDYPDFSKKSKPYYYNNQ